MSQWVLPSLSIAIPLLLFIVRNKKNTKKKAVKEYSGACHCKAIQFKFTAPAHLTVWDCNCSVCNMRKNWHVIVPESSFTLITGEDSITEYKFGSQVARHRFCKKCGVQAFYHPRSNPDGVGITFACVPVEQVESYQINRFDGENWEQFFATSDISEHSAK